MIPIVVREAFFSHVPKTVTVKDQNYSIGWRSSNVMPRDFALPAVLVQYSDEKVNLDRSPLNQLIKVSETDNGMIRRTLGERLQSLITLDIYAEDSVDQSEYVSRDRLSDEIIRLLDIWRMSILEDDLQVKGSGIESRSTVVDLSHLEEREWNRKRVEFIVGYWCSYDELISPIEVFDYNVRYAIGTKVLEITEQAIGTENVTKEET